MKRKKVITICSSASFYQQVLTLKKELENEGFKVIVPISALKMQQENDFNVDKHKSWYKDPAEYKQKTKLIRRHFEEVAKADAILVVNLEKRAVEGYIGGNVLMEMAVAFYLRKKIYILYPADSNSSYIEEIIGLEPIFINGDLSEIKHLR